MRFVVALSFVLLSISASAQINCNVYKEDPACYRACQLSLEAGYLQGSSSSQKTFDKALELCPTFDYAWFEKSVPYLKRGQFVEWKKLIDNAVELNPLSHLGYRGWCRYQFLRDYAGAIADIERLDSLTAFDIVYSVNGDYHLRIALAICYTKIGRPEKGIAVIEDFKKSKDYVLGPYEDLHMGVMKYMIKDYEGAREAFNRQIAYNDFQAENYYYLALLARELGDKAETISLLKQAQSYYNAGKHLQDPYTHHADRIFLSEIEEELKKESQ